MVDTAAGRPTTNSGPAAGLPPTPLPDLTVVPPVWSRITNLVVDHGEGSWLVTADGDRYLDYTSGIGVTNTGHAHPRVVAAIQAQAARLLHGQQNIVYHEPGLRLYERLAGLLPGGPWSAFLANSGAEAVEAAVKLARVATGRPAIVAFRYAFHGRTGQAMALTAAKDVYRGAFEPLPGSVYHAAYPYCYRAAGGPHDPSACTCDWEAELDLLFHQLVYPERVAAIIVEPVIGEGGYIVPPPGFLPRLREITRQHGMLLIADEVQTGFGRTGELFAVRHWDVEPDILVMAKGIASGLPLSGIVARRELMERFPPGSHGGTYGGNVVACAAALATLDVIEEEGLVANARDRGRQLLDGLRAAVAGRPAVGDVRGLGLMVALELVRPGEGDGRAPDPALTKRIQQACFDRGLLLLTAGTYVNVIRIIPPLVTTAGEIDTALTTLTEALDVAGA
jgi:4-aminobutyrate aminotransferase